MLPLVSVRQRPAIEKDFSGSPVEYRYCFCFRAGAEASGTEVQLNWSPVDYLAIRFNEPLAKSFQENAERLGREFLPMDQLSSRFAGSTDMGNVSHRVPSIHPMIAAAPPHCTIHNAEFAVHAGAEIGDAAALDGAKALAMTALDFLFDTDLRERTRNVFEAFSE